MANFAIPFPRKGIDKSSVTIAQPPMTSVDMNNMRLRDVFDERTRGGQRPGLDKWGAGTQIGAADNPVVAMCTVSTVS
ncbi:MAG TPA: hypothetical protein VMW50_06500 [Dehalococcoidia bacterium]|nr:hypothetical protein [Dehalococcoidia bacterium]